MRCFHRLGKVHAPRVYVNTYVQCSTWNIGLCLAPILEHVQTPLSAIPRGTHSTQAEFARMESTRG